MTDEYTEPGGSSESFAEPGGSSESFPEFPKPLVRLRQGANGYEADVLMVGSSEAETAATDAGWQAIERPPEMGRQRYPKWKFHSDGRRHVVSNKAEEDALDGFNDEPPPPQEEDIYHGAVPPAVGDAVMPPSSTRGPVPVDRG